MLIFIILQSICVWMTDPHYENKARNETYAHNWKEASKIIEIPSCDPKPCLKWHGDTFTAQEQGKVWFTITEDSSYFQIEVECPERAKGVIK